MDKVARARRFGQRVQLAAMALAAHLLLQANSSTISEVYPYYSPHDLSLRDRAVAAVCCVAPVFVMPLGVTAGAAATWVLYSLVYFCSATIGITTLPNYAEYISFMALMAVCLATFALASHLHPPVPRFRCHVPYLDWLCLSLCLLVAAWLWWKTGTTVRLGINDVYERRMAARESDAFVGYAIAPLRYLLPSLAIWAWFVRRSVLWPVAAASVSIVVFSFDGTKSSILLPIVLLLCLPWIFKGKLPTFLLAGLVLVNAVALTESLLLASTVLDAYLVRRAFLLPGILSAEYWSQASTFSNAGTLTRDAGLAFFGNEDTSANTNMFMWGWVWQGWFGALVPAVAAGVLVSFLDRVPGSRFPHLGTLMATLCALVWSTQFLHTSMLNSGIALVFLIAFAMMAAPDSFLAFRPLSQRLEGTSR